MKRVEIHHWLLAGLLLLMVVLLAPFVAAFFVQEQKIVAGDGTTDDHFGNSIAITSDGTRIAVTSAHDYVNGSVYVYTISGAVWTFEQKIVPVLGVPLDGQVAIDADGTRLAVGSRGAHSVLVYLRTGTAWALEQQITSGEGTDTFGSAVAMNSDGTRIVIGAPNTEYHQDIFTTLSFAGQAYVYSRPVLGTTWTLEQSLTESPRGGGKLFGQSVSMNADGTRIAIGAPHTYNFTSPGSVYVYSRSATTWTLEQSLTGGVSLFTQFGLSVSFDAGATRLLVGAGSEQAGYIFSRSGTVWTQEQQVTPSDVLSGGYGNSVSLDAAGSRAIIGARYSQVGANTLQGSAYVYSRSGTVWTQDSMIAADDGVASDYFGTWVAIFPDGSKTVVGAPYADVGANSDQGAAYVFFYVPPQTLSITFAGAGGGSVSSSPSGIDGCAAGCDAFFAPSTVVTLTATPDADSDFVGWSGDADCSDGSVTMSTDVSCAATFNLGPQLDITLAGTGTGDVTSAPAGINCGVDCAEHFTPSTVVTLTATPDTGNTFVGWTGDADCADGVVMMSLDVACTAMFEPVPSHGSTGSFLPGYGPFASPTPPPSVGGHTPADFGLHEGDLISAYPSGDPDVYIVNEWGFRRLFLNPIIFRFYSHLGGYGAVRPVPTSTRDVFPVSGLFTNCNTNDGKVYAAEITAEDTGILHHVQLTGDEALRQDPDFFKKVFCINTAELDWYPKSEVPYTSLTQLPVYRR